MISQRMITLGLGMTALFASALASTEPNGEIAGASANGETASAGPVIHPLAHGVDQLATRVTGGVQSGGDDEKMAVDKPVLDAPNPSVGSSKKIITEPERFFPVNQTVNGGLPTISEEQPYGNGRTGPTHPRGEAMRREDVETLLQNLPRRGRNQTIYSFQESGGSYDSGTSNSTQHTLTTNQSDTNAANSKNKYSGPGKKEAAWYSVAIGLALMGGSVVVAEVDDFIAPLTQEQAAICYIGGGLVLAMCLCIALGFLVGQKKFGTYSRAIMATAFLAAAGVGGSFIADLAISSDVGTKVFQTGLTGTVALVVIMTLSFALKYAGEKKHFNGYAAATAICTAVAGFIVSGSYIAEVWVEGGGIPHEDIFHSGIISGAGFLLIALCVIGIYAALHNNPAQDGLPANRAYGKAIAMSLAMVSGVGIATGAMMNVWCEQESMTDIPEYVMLGAGVLTLISIFLFLIGNSGFENRGWKFAQRFNNVAIGVGILATTVATTMFATSFVEDGLDKGLCDNMWAGIVMGSIAGLALIIAVIFNIVRTCKQPAAAAGPNAVVVV